MSNEDCGCANAACTGCGYGGTPKPTDRVRWLSDPTVPPCGCPRGCRCEHCSDSLIPLGLLDLIERDLP